MFEYCITLPWSCSSDVRNFRFVGTMTACHIATCLVRTMLTLCEERESAVQQETAEAKKKSDKASFPEGGAPLSPLRCGKLLSLLLGNIWLVSVLPSTKANAVLQGSMINYFRLNKVLQVALERSRAFKRTATRCDSQIRELQAYVSSIFQSVTTNRYSMQRPDMGGRANPSFHV